MEIIVEGTGRKFVTPDMITLHLNFVTKGNTYAEVLENGVKNVQKFVSLLLENQFQKEDMKTKKFIIREEKKYNEITRIYEKDGFSFQEQATLTFDYDQDVMANMMEKISKLENAPMYQIFFGIKDENTIRQNLLKDAYKEGEKQAKTIAQAAEKSLLECRKVDFKPMNTTYTSTSMLDGTLMRRGMDCFSATANEITNIFTSEDIELSETLYMLWIAK